MSNVTAVSASVRPASRLASNARLGWRQAKCLGCCVGPILLTGWRADEHGGNRCRLQPRAQIAAGQRQHVSEHRWRVRPREVDGEPSLADVGLVARRKRDRSTQLPARRRVSGPQDPAAVLNGTAIAQHVPGRIIRMQDSAARIRQQYAASERVEGVRHSRLPDRARVEHVADRHGAADMRQQQTAKLDLVLGDRYPAARADPCR